MGGKSSKSTTINKVPEWVEEGGKYLISQGRELAERPFEAYTGDRVADLTGDQTNAFAMLRDMVANAPNVTPTALDTIQRGATAPASTITPVSQTGTINTAPVTQLAPIERLVDESGRLGAMSDYINPYIEASLTPALRRIQEQSDSQGKKIGSMATMSGAFGDARHGILESALNRDTQLAMGETTAKGFADAFNAAMGYRNTDLNRFMDENKTNANLSEAFANRDMDASKFNAGLSEAFAARDMDAQRTNAQLGEQEAQRNITGGRALVDTSNAASAGALEQIRALLASGTAQQAQGQAGLDAQFQEFLRAYGNDFSVLQALGTALNSAPYTKESTTTSTQPSSAPWGVLGGLLGSI